MRVLLTALLTLAFVAAFVAFFALRSIVAFATDTGAVVEAAREAKARDAVVDALAAHAYEQLTASEAVETVSQPAIRAIIAEVLSEAWFERSLATAHTGLVRALDDASADAVVDLRAFAQAVERALVELRRRARAECQQLFGRRTCGDAAMMDRLLAAYDRDILGSVEAIPERVDLIDALTRGREPVAELGEIREVRENFARLRTWRWVGLGAMLLLLLLIAGVNAGNGGRALAAAGLAIALGAGIYLGVAAGYREVARDRLGDFIAGQRERAGEDGEMAEAIGQGAERVSIALLDAATMHSRTPVAIAGVAGVAMLAAGLVMRR